MLRSLQADILPQVPTQNLFFKIHKNSIKCKFIWQLLETLSLFIHYPTLVLIFNLTISIFQQQHEYLSIYSFITSQILSVSLSRAACTFNNTALIYEIRKQFTLQIFDLRQWQKFSNTLYGTMITVNTQLQGTQ